MIRNEHQIPGGEARVHTACGVGQQKLLCPQQSHQPDGGHHLFHGIALIIVNTALHDHHRDGADVTEDQLPGVACHGGYGETGQGVIGNLRFPVHQPGKVSQPGAQDNTDLRGEVRHFPDGADPFFQKRVCLGHVTFLPVCMSAGRGQSTSTSVYSRLP